MLLVPHRSTDTYGMRRSFFAQSLHSYCHIFPSFTVLPTSVRSIACPASFPVSLSLLIFEFALFLSLLFCPSFCFLFAHSFFLFFSLFLSLLQILQRNRLHKRTMASVCRRTQHYRGAILQHRFALVSKHHRLQHEFSKRSRVVHQRVRGPHNPCGIHRRLPINISALFQAHGFLLWPKIVFIPRATLVQAAHAPIMF